MRPFDIEFAHEVVETGLLLKAVEAWRACGFLLQGEVHALMAAVLLRLAGLDAFDGDAEAQPPDRELGEIEQGVWTGEGNAVVGADRLRQAALAKQSFEGRESGLLACRFQRLAEKQEARGVVGDGQRIAIASVTELELALEVGAPEFVGGRAFGQRRAARAMARPAAALDQAVAIEHGMDGAFGRHADVAGEPADQKLTDLACAPVRLLWLEADNEALDLLRQLIGVAHRAPAAVGKSLKPVFLVAIEDLVAGLPGYAELPAYLGHRLAIEQAGDKTQAFVHHRTLFPRHQHLPPKGKKCYPCVRYDVSPMSRVAHHKVSGRTKDLGSKPNSRKKPG